MIDMAKDDVLARVDGDLSRGHTHLAMQRLASLVSAFPDDLSLRARRAALSRQIGNRPEAGRWGFLTEEVTEPELAAFERAWPTAWSRLRALRLLDDPAGTLGPGAAQRMARLIAQAEQEGSAPVGWSAGPHPGKPDSWLDGLPCLVAGVLGLALLVLAGVGLVTVLRAIW
jgi:hypothetical protein